MGGKPFFVTDTLRNVAMEYCGCRVEMVDEETVRRLERKAYEAELRKKKLKRAKR